MSSYFGFPPLGTRVVACLLAGLVALGWASSWGQAPTAAFGRDTQMVDLTPFVEVLEDPGATLGLPSLVEPDLAGRFEPIDRSSAAGAFSDSALWLRFRLRTASGVEQSPLLVVAYPLLDHVELFEPVEGGFRHHEAGDGLPFRLWERQLRHPAFALKPTGGEERTYYLRIRSSGSLQAPLRLWSEGALLVALEREQLIFGLFLGAMVIVALLSALLSVLMRDRLFLLFAGFIASYSLLQAGLSGLAFQFLWPEATWWASRANPLLVAATGSLATGFIREFLELPVRLRRLDGLFRRLMAAGAVALLVITVADAGLGILLSLVYALVFTALAMTGALTLAFRGFRPARQFSFALGAFLLGMLVASLSYLGLLPYHAVTTHAMQIGSVLLVVMVAIAATDRLRQLQQAKALAAESAQRYLKALNEELERLVRDRTQALERTNAELKDLATRDSLTGLLNHKATFEQLEQLRRTAYRYREPLAVVMTDIDHFKDINDRFGHLVGDKVLVTVGHLLLQGVRASDVCGRYGGEEFLLVLPKANVDTAVELAERLRQQLASVNLPELGRTTITASFGVAEIDPLAESVSADAIIRRADEALYTAKRNGRNQVCCGRPLATAMPRPFKPIAASGGSAAAKPPPV
ncbi:MAG: diguanylate cyclase [Thermoanaerobaculales bacterium]|jgi:diguanylate cyclase|nr:diguanylate cyclase [Thermoanaerobaculales bacterium]MCU0971032.1 diguanylate cyclase [Gammaproteobacteria bacterium]